jgi:CBS domain-containing protein
MTPSAQVHDEMTKKALTVRPEDHLYHAFALMRRTGFRHLPVVADGELVGMLSDRDIFRHGCVRNDELVVGFRRVADAMSKGIWTCQVGDRIGDIAEEMVRRHIDALPVVDKQRHLIGIITSTDLLKHVQRTEGVLDVGALTAGRIEDEAPESAK